MRSRLRNKAAHQAKSALFLDQLSEVGILVLYDQDFGTELAESSCLAVRMQESIPKQEICQRLRVVRRRTCMLQYLSK